MPVNDLQTIYLIINYNYACDQQQPFIPSFTIQTLFYIFLSCQLFLVFDDICTFSITPFVSLKYKKRYLLMSRCLFKLMLSTKFRLKSFKTPCSSLTLSNKIHKIINMTTGIHINNHHYINNDNLTLTIRPSEVGQRPGNSDVDNASRDCFFWRWASFLFASSKTVPW